ncbi:helix-turn-helix domain-containing protein [Saccharopolyspora endophytica]|uniref:Helix-turn-helix domain-containing protein n=1 Tax=Saccharopolyspora endophytica TaxID=543886 RepID=A0ABS5DJZ7_9PSEU|nr:helix-turn-helix transcriptional regulator [Saccharopolyspora endophytica]MBQ0926611.1 helix-turn-helix domain-containing protein [Saccharopolyspora endophytica]
MANTADSPRARALGAELRRHRRAADMTTTQVGEGIGKAHSYVSRVENGKQVPTEADLASLLFVLRVNGDEREQLLELGKAASDPDWLAPGVDRQLAALTEYERTAKRIIAVEPLLVPGLLQTFDYARETVAAFGSSGAEAEQSAMTRLGRQHVLTDEPPTTLDAFIGDFALRNSMCAPEVMRDQLHRLLDRGQRPNITIRVVPMAQPPAEVIRGSWTLMTFEDTRPVVYIEPFGSTAAITDRRTVTRCEAAVDALHEKAMSPAASAELIADLVKEME